MFIRSRSVLFFVSALLILTGPVFAAGGGNLYSMYSDKTVKIYIADVKDTTKEHEMDPQLIKQKLEEALKNRKSIHFEITQNFADAELLVNTEVSEFMWTDHDPVDMLMGAAATAYDIATIEDYARLQADLTVIDGKSKKELWRDLLIATVTKKPMPRKDSQPLVSEELARIFIKNCFSKRRAN